MKTLNDYYNEYNSQVGELMGIIARINDTECSISEDHVLAYSFPDGKEYIFSLKPPVSMAGYDLVYRRGQGVLLNLPDDLDHLREAKEEHYRFYIFDPSQTIFQPIHTYFYEFNESLRNMIRERYNWLVAQFY